MPHAAVMPKFAANLSLLFTELPFLERFAAARAAGFAAVECQFPYAFPPEKIAQALHACQLQMVLHNLPAGDWAAGERGIACLPARREEFRQGVAQAIAYAQVLGVTQLNCLGGSLPPDTPPELAQKTLVDNLRFAAQALQKAGIRLLLEPINSLDIPGFFPHRTAQARAIMDEVNHENLFLQFDIYHAQRMDGEFMATLKQHMHRIAHIQIADVPGRHEPGSGTIDFGRLFAYLDQTDYPGWIGCEYIPRTTTHAGLDWLSAYRNTNTTRIAPANHV